MVILILLILIHFNSFKLILIEYKAENHLLKEITKTELSILILMFMHYNSLIYRFKRILTNLIINQIKILRSTNRKHQKVIQLYKIYIEEQ